MITLLYQFKKGNVKVTQVSLPEFAVSNTLKNEIKRTYGKKGDAKLTEILNDPHMNGPNAASSDDSPHHVSGISEPHLLSSSLLFGPEDQGPSRTLHSPSLANIFQAKGKELGSERESKSKARHLIPQGLKDTFKKFKSIQAAYEAYLTRHGRRHKGEITVAPLSQIQEEMTQDSSLSTGVTWPPEVQQGEMRELVRMIEEADLADSSEAARQGEATRSDSDSDSLSDWPLKDTYRGKVPATGVGGSQEQGVEEAGRQAGVHGPAAECPGVTYADDDAADSARSVLQHPPQEMQTPQQISSGDEHLDNSGHISSQTIERLFNYVDRERQTRVPARFGTSPSHLQAPQPREQTDAYRGVTPSETATGTEIKTPGLSPPRSGQQTLYPSKEQFLSPSAGRQFYNRTISLAHTMNDWNEDDLPLITEEQYRHIVLQDLEDEKPPHLQTQEPRHPQVREYQRRLLQKADRHARKEEEPAEYKSEYEAMPRTRLKRSNRTESNMRSRYRQGHEEASESAQPRMAELHSAEQQSAQSAAYGQNKTRHLREQPSGYHLPTENEHSANKPPKRPSRPMSPSRKVSEWHEDELPLITEEGYRRILLDELEDEKPRYLRKRPERHPLVKEYQRKLLDKADHHRFKTLQKKAREEVRREQEQSEYEDMSKRHTERISQTESDTRFGYREDHEEAGAGPEQQPVQQRSSQQTASGENPTRRPRARPSDIRSSHSQSPITNRWSSRTVRPETSRGSSLGEWI